MLEHHPFCDHCPGCRPALIDANTGRPLPDDSPTMRTVNQIWDHETTYAQRKAFIEVTLHNSRDPNDLWLGNVVLTKIQKAIGEGES